MGSLVAAAEAVGVELLPAQQAQFRRYRELLQEWSDRASLTAVRDDDAILEQLFIRSFRVAVPAGGSVPTAGWWSGRRVIDVGSGGGIPGLPLKLLQPDAFVTLLESNRKRCAFLAAAIAELGIDGVEVVNARAETAAHDPAYREQYDVATARGLARLPTLAEEVLPFLKLGGVAVLPKGADAAGVQSEAEAAAFAADELGAAPAFIQPVEYPGTAPVDYIVYWLKVQPTPERFPRRVGVPSKRPRIRSMATASRAGVG